MVLILAGLFLFVKAARHCQRAIHAESFATGGPFEYIRHPIYASMYLLCAGLGLVFFTWLHFLVLVVFLPLWWIECKREEEAIRRKHGEKYARYQEHTSMIIPGVL
jgi:protein-S-isoprenylcysteine O-methyltransferase Ste14